MPASGTCLEEAVRIGDHPEPSMSMRLGIPIESTTQNASSIPTRNEREVSSKFAEKPGELSLSSELSSS